jgi:hypothetical protein
VRSGGMGEINPSAARAEAQIPVLMNVCGQPASHARHRIVGTGSTSFSLKRHLPAGRGTEGVMRQPMGCLYLGDRVGRKSSYIVKYTLTPGQTCYDENNIAPCVHSDEMQP